MKIICPDPNYNGEANIGPVCFHESISIPQSPVQQQTHEERGRALWKEIHEKTDPTPEWFAKWLSRVPNTSGCGSCQKWAIDWIKIPGNEPDYDNWFPWSVLFHNGVNAKIDAEGRPREQWTLERARNHYYPLALAIVAGIAPTG